MTNFVVVAHREYTHIHIMCNVLYGATYFASLDGNNDNVIIVTRRNDLLTVCKWRKCYNNIIVSY